MKLSHLVISGLLSFSCTVAMASGDSLLRESVSSISLKKLGTYESGVIDESAAEIVAYDDKSQRVFVTNANDKSIDVISIRNPRYPHKVFSIDLTPYGAPNSVAVSKGVVAVAVEADAVGTEGQVVFFNRRGKLLNARVVKPVFFREGKSCID